MALPATLPSTFTRKASCDIYGIGKYGEPRGERRKNSIDIGLRGVPAQIEMEGIPRHKKQGILRELPGVAINTPLASLPSHEPIQEPKG